MFSNLRRNLHTQKTASRRTLLQQIHVDKAKGMTNVAIAEKHNLHESTIRGMLRQDADN